jgi:hypothetical protein
MAKTLASKRQVPVYLNDFEVAALLHHVEEADEEYKQEYYWKYETNLLLEKLNDALKKFAEPEEEPSDNIICHFIRKELETIRYVVESVYDNDPELWLEDVENKDYIKHVLDKLQGILRQGF